MKFIYIGLPIIVGVLILLFLFGLFAFGRVFFHVSFDRRKGDKDFAKNENPNDKKRPARLWFSEQHLEELEILSFDKLKLKGYLISQKSNKLAIICHGYRGRYYSSAIQAKIFYEHGYDVFLPNNRAHDTSEGDTFTMGSKERKDLLKWINTLIERNPNYEIVLMGISMGAHIVMTTSGEKSLPSNVKCFIEDCGYHRLKDILYFATHNRAKVKLSRTTLFFGEIYSALFHGFNFTSSVKKAFKNVKIPGLFIHGDKDENVPYENMAKNYNAMPKNLYKEMVTFEGVMHNKSQFVEPKYKNTIINFVDRFIK